MNLPYFNLIQVNLIGLPYGLSSQETEDLWMQADINGNGVVGYEEFKVRLMNIKNVEFCFTSLYIRVGLACPTSCIVNR